MRRLWSISSRAPLASPRLLTASTMSSGINGDVDIVPAVEEDEKQAGGSIANTASPSPGLINGAATGSDGTPFKLGSFSIDEYRPLKVVVIGAGFSGIIAGIRCAISILLCKFLANNGRYRFPQRIKNLDLTIYDKNAGVGGTWYTNRYPVCTTSVDLASLVT